LHPYEEIEDSLRKLSQSISSKLKNTGLNNATGKLGEISGKI
jgi:hypothetical protein